jgi:hypothetical protein
MGRNTSTASAFEYFYNKIVDMPPMIDKRDLAVLVKKCHETFKRQIIRAYDDGYMNYTIPRRFNWTGLRYYETKFGNLRRSKSPRDRGSRALNIKKVSVRECPYVKSYKFKRQEHD